MKKYTVNAVTIILETSQNIKAVVVIVTFFCRAKSGGYVPAQPGFKILPLVHHVTLPSFFRLE